MHHHLTLRQLDYFIEIVEAGNITRAAAQLRVAPTALSLQVRAMEDWLGVGLLQRHSRGVRPTAAGAELYQKARQILEMVDETERLVSPGASASERPVRLGVIPPMLRMIGVDAVVAGTTRADGLVVEIVEGLSSRLLARLEDHDLDFVLVYEAPPTPAIETISLLEDHFVFATRPGARAPGSVPLAEALASELAFYSTTDAGWNAVHAAARSADLPVRVAHKVGSVDVIRHMVARGLASTILPFGLLKEEVGRGEIAVHAIEDHPVAQRLQLAWLKEAHRASDFDRVLGFVAGAAVDQHARTRPYSVLIPRPARPRAGAH